MKAGEPKMEPVARGSGTAVVAAVGGPGGAGRAAVPSTSCDLVSTRFAAIAVPPPSSPSTLPRWSEGLWPWPTRAVGGVGEMSGIAGGGGEDLRERAGDKKKRESRKISSGAVSSLFRSRTLRPISFFSAVLLLSLTHAVTYPPTPCHSLL